MENSFTCNSSICNFIPEKGMRNKRCFDTQISIIRLHLSNCTIVSYQRWCYSLSPSLEPRTWITVPEVLMEWFLIFFFLCGNWLEEDHGLMKSTDDAKSYVGVLTTSSTKPLNETVTADIIDWLRSHSLSTWIFLSSSWCRKWPKGWQHWKNYRSESAINWVISHWVIELRVAESSPINALMQSL